MNVKPDDSLKSIINELPCAVAVLDADLTLVCASERWTLEIEPAVAPVIDEAMQWARRALAGEEIHIQEDCVSQPDGRALWIEWNMEPWRGAGGDIAGVTIVARDITRRKKMEVALMDSEAFLHEIVDSNPVAIVTADTAGKILFFNRVAERIFCFASDDAIGQNVTILMTERDAQDHAGHIARYLRTGETRLIGSSRIVTARRQDGSSFPARLHLTEFQDGTSIFVSFIEDLTEEYAAQKKIRDTQEQLQHSARLGALGEMATTIAHEINQPLTAAASLAGAAALVLRKGSAAKAADAVDLIEDAVNELRRASEIIYQMRDFAKTRKSAPSLNDVNVVVESAASIALIGAAGDGIEADFDLDPVIGSANFDRIQLEQVIVNLIRNAVDAVKDASTKKLAIKTRKKDETFEISIADSGPGVAPEMRKRLFEPFATDKASGLGVGLSISKSIIDAHQGEIVVSSDELGGASFTVILPLGA